MFFFWGGPNLPTPKQVERKVMDHPDSVKKNRCTDSEVSIGTCQCLSEITNWKSPQFRIQSASAVYLSGDLLQ